MTTNSETYLIKRVLYNDVCEDLCYFFTDVLELARQYRLKDITLPVYIAVITRRCYVLFFAYYKLLCSQAENPDCSRPKAWSNCDQDTLNEYKLIFEDCVITDNAAWAMAYEIASDYLESLKENIEGRFPRLIVTDELLFHGRSLNSFLFGFEERLRQGKSLYREEAGDSFSGNSNLLDAFLNKLDIFVANWNSGSSVLLPRYQKKLLQSGRDGTLPIEKWRERSLAYAQYVSVCGVNNVGFTISFAVPAESEIITENAPSELIQDNLSFTKVCTSLQNIKQDTYLYFYPSVEQPRIVCSVRHKQSLTELRKDMYVPYIIVDNIPWEQIVELHNEIVRDAKRCGKSEAASLLELFDPVDLSKVTSYGTKSQEEIRSLVVPWLTQTVDLVLTSWLMKRFLRQVKGMDEEEILVFGYNYIEWGQLIGNFRSYDRGKLSREKIDSALKELWTWNPDRSLKDYLKIYAHNANPFYDYRMGLKSSSFSSSDLNEDAQLVMCLEDSIAHLALEAERNAYALYGSGIPFPDEAKAKWGGNHSIAAVLDVFLSYSTNYPSLDVDNSNLYEVIAILVQAMDLGLIDMNTVYGYQSDSGYRGSDLCSWKVYTHLRAGEAALFILPIRFRNLITVLGQIYDIRRSDFPGVRFDIDSFINKLSNNDDSRDIQISDSIKMTAGQLKLSLFDAYKMLVRGGQKFSKWMCELSDRRLSEEEQKNKVKLNRRLFNTFCTSYLNR